MTSIKKSSSFVLSPINGVGVFIFISLKDGMGAGGGCWGGGVDGEDGGEREKVGSARLVCIEVPVNAIVVLHSRSVPYLVCSLLDEIELTLKYSFPEVGSDRCLIRGSPPSLELLSVLGTLKIPLCSVIVDAELG